MNYILIKKIPVIVKKVISENEKTVRVLTIENQEKIVKKENLYSVPEVGADVKILGSTMHITECAKGNRPFVKITGWVRMDVLNQYIDF